MGLLNPDGALPRPDEAGGARLRFVRGSGRADDLLTGDDNPIAVGISELENSGSGHALDTAML